MRINGEPHRMCQSYPLRKSNNIINKEIHARADKLEDKISNIHNKYKDNFYSINNVKLKELSNNLISSLKDYANRCGLDDAHVDIPFHSWEEERDDIKSDKNLVTKMEIMFKRYVFKGFIFHGDCCYEHYALKVASLIQQMKDQHVSLCNSNPDAFSEESECSIKSRLLLEFAASGMQSHLLSVKSAYEKQSNALKNRVILKIIIKEFLRKHLITDNCHKNLLHAIVYFKNHKFPRRDMHGKLTNLTEKF